MRHSRQVLAALCGESGCLRITLIGRKHSSQLFSMFIDGPSTIKYAHEIAMHLPKSMCCIDARTAPACQTLRT